jgi:RHS repeat-associated protein
MRKTVASTSTAFVWDTAPKDCLSWLQDGATSYVTGPQCLPLEQVSSSGTVLYYHADQLGSTRMLTDSSGKIAATYSNDGYGIASANAGTIANPFGFAGQYTDAESGLLYLRARCYDPATGQFLSVDPLATLTRETYPYVHDDPVNETDPSGKVPDPQRLVGTIVDIGADYAGIETPVTLVQRFKTDAWFFAYRGMPVYVGDKIQTFPGTVASIEFSNGTQIGVNVETTVVIDTEASVQDISVRRRWTKFLLNLGTIWCKITHQARDESFTVESRGGVLGTRG